MPEPQAAAMALPAPMAPPAWAGAPQPEAVLETEPSELMPLRIAGGVLVLGGLLLLWERATFPELFAAQGLMAHNWVSGIIDLGLGGALLAGRTQLAGLARLRVVIGALLFTTYWLVEKNAFAAIVQAAYSVGLLLLLLGTAGLARRAVALVLVLVSISMELTSARALRTGRNPLGRIVLALQGGTEPIPDGQVQGLARPYALSVPDAAWRLRDEKAARRDNPQSDRWLVHPTYDAHVMVMVEELPPGTYVPRERAVEAVVENLKKSFPGLQVDGEPDAGLEGTLVRAHGTVKGRALAFRVMVATGEGVAYTLLGFVPEAGLPYVEDDLTAMLQGFTRG